MQIDRTIPNNKVDIIIRENNKGTLMLIDAQFHEDRKMIKKEDEKILEYEDLIIKIQSMWNVKAKAILVTIWATKPLQNHSDST